MLNFNKLASDEVSIGPEGSDLGKIANNPSNIGKKLISDGNNNNGLVVQPALILCETSLLALVKKLVISILKFVIVDKSMK